LDATYEGESQRLGLAPATRYLLLRIAQEALNNVWKHAPSSKAVVSLHERAGRLELTIADNGPGFDVSQSKPGHFGLDGMRARAHLLGAELTIDSRAGQGTRVVVRQPPSR
jgi:two-component system sensor histidine kinase DegS